METPANSCTRLSLRRCIHASFFSTLILVSSAMGTDITVDNGDPGTSFTGAWTASGDAGAYAGNSLWASAPAAYTWKTELPDGTYEVFMWWTESASGNSAVPVLVEHDAGTEQLTINQQIRGGAWNSLGTYTFSDSGTVTLLVEGDCPVTCADAVRFVRVDSPPADSIVIIDNGDAETSAVGSWPVSGGKNAYESHSVYSRTAGHAFSWHFTAPSTGDFEVSMWWTEFSSRSNAAPVEIENADGTAMVTVNQLTDGGRWNVLGSYPFEEGKTYRVTIRTLTDKSSVCADAVRFERIHAPDETIIDNSDSAAEAVGTWTACDGRNPYGDDSVCSRTPEDSFSWFFTPSADGYYEAGIWWPQLSSGSDAAPVEVQHRLGSSLVTVNQLSNGGRWNVLGTYQFEAGETYRVTIRTLADESAVCADAVRFVRVSAPPIKADFTVEFIDGNPLNIQFRDLSTSDNSIIAWKWDYGNDGQIDSTEQNPVHAFTEPGPHSVALTVESFSGTDTVVKENLISADAVAPASTAYDILLDDSQSGSLAIEEAAAAASTENIYVCVGYGTERMNTQLESMLRGLGARLSSGVWTYSRAGKTYRIYNVTSVAGMKSAMRTSGAHILYFGHSNYGLGQMFATSAEMTAQKITNFRYVDDDRILNCSTPTVAVSVSGMINSQAYPNWRPIFKDGSSAIAPYNFGDPRGDPPYNYYLTYRIPGDSTYYRIDSPRNPPLTRFSGSGKPAWYSSSGAVPNPNNSDHRKYFITNSSASTSSGSFNYTGSWAASTSTSGYYGSNYLWISAASGRTARATWNTTAASSANYNVFARWSATSGRCSSAPYTITHNGGTTTVRVDQRTNGARWNNLGRFALSSGRTYPVYVTNNASSGTVIADAVMVSHASNPPYVLQADFYAATRSGSAPLTVTFNSLCTGQADQKVWTWGDGTSSRGSGTSFSKTYTRAGTYSVMLTARGAGNSHTVTKTGYIVVGSSAPSRVEFSATGREGTLSRRVVFTNRTSGSIRSVRWDFGNGVTSTTNNPTYTYTQPGNYTVSLRVTFTNGSTQTVTKPNFVRARYYESIFDNTTTASTSTAYHYGTRTILMRGPIEVSPSEMKYSRLFLLSCSSGEYYLQTMGRGVVFYSLDTTAVGPGPGFSLYLKAYLEGKSNAQILTILQRKAKFDYYDFTKRPQDQ